MTDITADYGPNRSAPHAVEAEEAVLGCVLINPDAYFEVSAFLRPDDFYLHKNRWIWNAFVNLQPFALTAEELPNYNLSYVGKEKIDDLNTYVFDVTPKAMSDPRALKRLKDQKIEGKYLQGRIWVDDQDLQVVKVAGKTVPEFKQRFPKFETYRENIDGRYWFPTYTYGEDTLEFDSGQSVKVRMVVKYKEYRQFQSDVKITSVEEEVVDPKDKSGAAAKAGEAPTTATPAKPAEKPVEKKAEPERTPRKRP